jgi:hypothetical protein
MGRKGERDERPEVLSIKAVPNIFGNYFLNAFVGASRLV